MADAVASCSNPWVTITVLWATPTQPVRTFRQSVTRVGSKSANDAIVARDSRADKWAALSNDVLSIHEMHRKSNEVVCWSNPCVRMGGAQTNRVCTWRANATDRQTITRPRRKITTANAPGSLQVTLFKEVVAPSLDRSTSTWNMWTILERPTMRLTAAATARLKAGAMTGVTDPTAEAAERRAYDPGV